MVLRVECSLCSGQKMPELTEKAHTRVWHKAED